MTVTSSQSFEEAVAEYIEKSRAQIGEEIMEHIPPWPPAPFEQGPPPFEAALRLDSQSIMAFARNLGDDNPLYTDPEYGEKHPLWLPDCSGRSGFYHPLPYRPWRQEA